MRDGLYRLDRGSENARALLIKGKSVLIVGKLWGSILGTWKVDGGPMVITTTSAYRRGSFSETFRYAFAVKGDMLHLYEDEFEDMPIEVWRKVDSLCGENASFNCKVSTCTCKYVASSSFETSERCFWARTSRASGNAGAGGSVEKLHQVRAGDDGTASAAAMQPLSDAAPAVPWKLIAAAATIVRRRIVSLASSAAGCPFSRMLSREGGRSGRSRRA
ncbi:hypothetical protein [Myxococcus sp. Y35]|uniref:hypothetical protein n=1 Tax=Pseudomyxococcus flavus TaxID=3115648 RepID=UPI003CE78D63